MTDPPEHDSNHPMSNHEHNDVERAGIASSVSDCDECAPTTEQPSGEIQVPLDRVSSARLETHHGSAHIRAPDVPVPGESSSAPTQQPVGVPISASKQRQRFRWRGVTLNGAGLSLAIVGLLVGVAGIVIAMRPAQQTRLVFFDAAENVATAEKEIGQCWQLSKFSDRKDARACLSQGALWYDPCFLLIDREAAVCPAQDYDGTVRVVDYTSDANSFPDDYDAPADPVKPGEELFRSRPWRLILDDGDVCLRSVGTIRTEELGRPIEFLCAPADYPVINFVLENAGERPGEELYIYIAPVSGQADVAIGLDFWRDLDVWQIITVTPDREQQQRGIARADF